MRARDVEKLDENVDVRRGGRYKKVMWRDVLLRESLCEFGGDDARAETSLLLTMRTVAAVLAVCNAYDSAGRDYNRCGARVA